VTHYLIGLVVGATGALIGVYAFAALLPATREERPRDPLPGRRGVYYSGTPNFPITPNLSVGGTSDDTWTSGPIT
jgi:hypothetical protein